MKEEKIEISLEEYKELLEIIGFYLGGLFGIFLMALIKVGDDRK